MAVGVNLGKILGTTLSTSLGQPPSTESEAMGQDITDGLLTGAGVADSGNMAATFQTRGLPVHGRRLSICASWTGTPTGTFSLECLFQDLVWRTVPGAAAEFTANSQIQPAGGTGSAVWNWSNIPGSKWRLVYTASSGTGTLTSAFAQAS